VTNHSALRVLHVTPYYAPAFVYGGPTRSVPLLCRGLVAAGANVKVLTTDANGEDRLDLRLDQPHDVGGVEVHYFHRLSRSRRFRSPELEHACRQMVGTVDLVHITGLWNHPAAVAAAIARRAGVPYVVSPRGMLMAWEFSHKGWKKRPYFWWREAPSLRRAAAIHCTTTAEQQAVMDRIPGLRTFVVPNGIQVEEFESLPGRNCFRGHLGINPNVPLILFLGRLHEKKGIDALMNAFLRLKEDRSDAHLVIAGPSEDEYEYRIRTWIGDNGLTRSVHVTGELRDRERLAALRDADVFALLSRSENFGMGVAEAMACGVPVVVSPGVGLSDWVRDWHAGIVTQVDELSASAALCSALDDAAGPQLMGKNGRRLAETVFAMQAVGQRMLEEYRTLVSQ
jgi:glycosyltransferase involved in cell wall biosynthesis